MYFCGLTKGPKLFSTQKVLMLTSTLFDLKRNKLYNVTQLRTKSFNTAVTVTATDTDSVGTLDSSVGRTRKYRYGGSPLRRPSKDVKDHFWIDSSMYTFMWIKMIFDVRRIKSK